MGKLTLTTFDWVPEMPRGYVRDLRVRWALEEAGLPYTVESAPFKDRQSDHFAHQPFGQVPWLTDGAISIFESGAILLHLGEMSDALLPTDPQARSDAKEWLFAALNSVEMASLPWSIMIFSGQKGEGPTWPLFDKFLNARLGHVETVLGGRAWLAGAFSIADIAMADVLRLVDRFEGLEDYPACSDYVARAVARSAFAKAHADQMAHFARADEVDGSRSRHLGAKMGLLSCNPSKEPPTMEINTIGLDLAKNVFQVHAISATGEVVIRKALRRSQMLPFFEKLPPCLVGAEACGTSHHWARELTRLGHEVRLMPAVYVKPYVKRGKNDAADAEAICEAVTRQTMRFVPIKSREQQAALSLHRVRSLLIKQRTQLVNMMRSVLAELGVAIPVGIVKALQMAREIVDGESRLDLPTEATNVVGMLAGQLLQLHVQLRKLDLRLAALQRSDDRARRLATIPGIGPIGATALAASVTDPSQFSSGRQFAAWLGLTPRQSSSGGKERLGRITKMGDRYLRQLLVIGATALVRYAKEKPGTVDPRFVALLARKPARVASVAIANKMARIAWALMARGGVFERGHAPMLAAA